MSQTVVVFGGPSPEHDVSVLTGLQAARALLRLGDRSSISAVYWSKDAQFFAVAADLEAEAFMSGVPPKAIPLHMVAEPGVGFVPAASKLGRARPIDVDVVVNCCHGGPGEDGTLSAVFDLVGMHHAGPSVAGAALGMDKLAFAAAAASIGLPTLPRALLTPKGCGIDFAGPYIVKPRFGGSSIGIDVVADLDTARARLLANVHLRRGAIIEPYRSDLFDLNIAVRTWPELSLSAIERPSRRPEGAAGAILGYAEKYVAGQGMAGAPRQVPADIPSELDQELRVLAARVAEVAVVRGVARIDFLSDGQALFVNEINTIPGSLAKYLWVDPVIDFAQLLESMIAEAKAVPGAQYSSAGADGSVLSAAGGIAGKLG